MTDLTNQKQIMRETEKQNKYISQTQNQEERNQGDIEADIMGLANKLVESEAQANEGHRARGEEEEGARVGGVEMERQSERRGLEKGGEMEGKRERTIPTMGYQGEDHWTSSSCS